jgi:hypothetical protein
MNYLVIFTYTDGTTNQVDASDMGYAEAAIEGRRTQAGLVSYSVYQLVNTYTKEVTWTAKNS